MTLPRLDFFVIGAQKSGTTSLAAYLSRHPSIHMPRVKELQYFSRDEFFDEGERYLRAYLGQAEAGQRVGAADVQAMFVPETAERLHAHDPEMRCIAVLRDPVDRAHSAFWFARRNQLERIEDFGQALEVDATRDYRDWEERAALAYLEHGDYEPQLRRFYQCFGPDRVRVLLTEELHERAPAVLAELFEWLGVDPSVAERLGEVESNPAGVPRSVWLQRWLRAPGPRRIYRRLVPAELRYRLRHAILSPLARANISAERYPAMDPGVRKRLREHYAPMIARLERLTQRDLSHWLRGGA